MPDTEFTPSTKSQEELQADKNAYIQRILQLENEEEDLNEKLKVNQASLQQIRGVLAYIEMNLGDMQQMDIIRQKDIEVQKQAEATKAAEAAKEKDLKK